MSNVHSCNQGVIEKLEAEIRELKAYREIARRWIIEEQKKDAEISSLKQLLAKERDEFGKKETELLAKTALLKDTLAKGA